MTILKYRLSIFSPNPDKLAKFYIDILGLKLIHKINKTDDYGYSLEAVKGYKIWIGKHSKIKTKNKDPLRFMFTLYVDNLENVFKKVKNYDNDLVVENPKIYCLGMVGEERTVCTFLDFDGNCVQLMQMTGK